MIWDQNLIQLFVKGGFAMWPILACSIIGTAIIIERALYFFRMRTDYVAFSKNMKDLLSKKQYKDVLLLCRKHPNPVPRLAGEYIQQLDNNKMRDEILKREGSIALEKVEANLRGLAAITHISPLLGLLGTVTGLVSAFHQIEILGGQVQPSDLAAGIWEALITTVFGLIVAIPCMAAYHGFEVEADKIARRMQFIVSELDEFFSKHSTQVFQSDNVANIQQKMNTVS